VRGCKKNKMLSFILCIPVDVKVNGNTILVIEIKFCVNQRSHYIKKLAPVLIKKEIH